MAVNLPNRQTTVKELFAHLALEKPTRKNMSFAIMAKDQPRPNNITALRERKRLTIEQLAERSGLSVSYISRMANGGRNVSVKNLEKLAKALGVTPMDLIAEHRSTKVPIVTWVSAGRLARDDGQHDTIGEIEMPDLDPDGEWVALRVEGDSMDRISPPGSLIFVDLSDRELVPNACYVVADDDNHITYKRFRPNPHRFEAVSTNLSHQAIFPDGSPTVIGRVRRSIIDM